MDLAYTDEQKAFREEVRSWLADNVPDQPLTTFDTKEGLPATPRVGGEAQCRPLGHGYLA